MAENKSNNSAGMSNKQIEEMARDLCECYNCDGTCYQDDKPCDLRCDEYTNAQYLYEKGYRKASEVAEEIFAETELTARAVIILLKFEKDEKLRNTKTGCYEDLLGYIAELKKKYKESEKENGKI